VYVVQAGDRLWDLAERLGPEDDPRRFVQQVRDLNELTTSAIVPGQKLFLPSG
jgi:LysM repeat protein